MARIRPYISLALVAGGALALVAVVSLNMLGGRVSTVFSSINSGLDGGPGGGSSPAQVSDPIAQAPGGGPPALEQSDIGPAPNAPPADQQRFDRLVIRTADVTIEVGNVRDAEGAIRAQVGQLGGYVVRSETSGADASMSAQITFRVPAARFDQALSGVQGLAKKVLARTVSGDDVTEEFIDLESRLRHLEATRDRLLTFLQTADKVEDALRVNESLSAIQGEIEQIVGRRQFLQQSAAFSTILVALSPVPPVAPLVAENGWRPIGVARDALRGLIGFGQVLANVAIVILVWSPVWLPPLLWWGWRWRRKRRFVDSSLV
jgi:hypothetical protein